MAQVFGHSKSTLLGTGHWMCQLRNGGKGKKSLYSVGTYPGSEAEEMRLQEKNRSMGGPRSIPGAR